MFYDLSGSLMIYIAQTKSLAMACSNESTSETGL